MRALQSHLAARGGDVPMPGGNGRAD
jgi:hypothetical protein